MTTSKSTEAVLGHVVAVNLQRLMQAQHKSKGDLARESGRPLPSVESALSGQSEQVTLADLEGFSAALGVRAMDLVRMDPKEV